MTSFFSIKSDKLRAVNRIFSLTLISIFSSTLLEAQKMDTTNIIGKWKSVDTASKRTMTFYFDDKSNASINYGSESISLKYSLDTADSKKVLIFMTADNRRIKNTIRFRSNDELELFASKMVDFSSNLKAWGINEFMLLKRE